jgi:ankyrin repeat protein
MFAAKSNDVNKVKMLLDAGSDVNAIKPGEALYSALGIAAAQGNRELVQMLLQAGADIHWRDMHGIDILKRAAMEAEDSVAASMIEFLASAGLSCQSSDDEGFFAIHNAAQEGKAEVIRTLIKYGADPNQKVLAGDDEGTVPLKYAVQSGSYEVYSTLIELGADVSTFRQEQKEFDDILFIGDEGGGTTLDLLDSLFFNDLQRTNGHYVEKDMFQIANDLVENRGFRPSMNSLAQSLLYDHGEELRSILFRASKKEFIEYGINKNPINFLAILGAIIHIYDIDLKTNVLENLKKVFASDLGSENETIEDYMSRVEDSCGKNFNVIARDLGIIGESINFIKENQGMKSVIDKCGLKEWWSEEFSEEERETVVNNIGTIDMSLTSIPKILSNIATQSFQYNFIKENRSIVQKFYEKADQLFEKSDDIIDRHFFYNNSIRFYYADRENKESMKKAIEACRKQIDIAPSASENFKRFHGRMPEHTGYKQLAIILDKQNKYDEAIKICNQAQSEGWAGDWIPRIARYEKAKAKIKK